MKKLLLLTAFAVSLNSTFVHAESYLSAASDKASLLVIKAKFIIGWYKAQDLFFTAINDNDISKVKLALSNGADVNAAKDYHGITALDVALANGYTEIVKILLAQGADVRAKALHDAARKGYVEIVKILLAHGADVNAKDNYVSGRTPLYYAASHGHKELVTLLIAYGADKNAELSEALTNNHSDVAKLLFENGAGADVNAKDKYGKTALLKASQSGHVEIAELLLAHGADVNAEDNDGSTPLSSIFYGPSFTACDKQVVKLLVAHGADVNVALHKVLNSNRAELARLLFKYVANFDANAKDKNGWTLLHRAAFAGYSQIVDLLVARGADLNAKNNNGWTPLDCAAFKGHKAVVDLLVERGGAVTREWETHWAYLKLA